MLNPVNTVVKLGGFFGHGQKSEKRDILDYDLDMDNHNIQAHLHARRHGQGAVKGGNDHAHMRRRHHHDYNHDPKKVVVSDSANVHKRSSVVIPNNHGSSYIVSHSRRNHGMNVAESRAYLGRRDQGGVPGTVDIMASGIFSCVSRLFSTSIPFNRVPRPGHLMERRSHLCSSILPSQTRLSGSSTHPRPTRLRCISLPHHPWHLRRRPRTRLPSISKCLSLIHHGRHWSNTVLLSTRALPSRNH